MIQKDLSAPPGWSWIVILLFFGLLMTACNHRPPLIERDNFEVKMYPSKGKCWNWDSIEHEIAGHTICAERRKINGFNMVCTRKLGHRRAHHMHGSEDCFWIW